MRIPWPGVGTADDILERVYGPSIWLICHENKRNIIDWNELLITLLSI